MNFNLYYYTFKKCHSELTEVSVVSLAKPNIAVYTTEQPGISDLVSWARVQVLCF